MIGEQIGPYRVLEELRKGGMGHLKLALDTRLHRRVVLKFLPAELEQDESTRRRFQLESNALAALNHPNIVTIHAVEEIAGRPFLVMEWVDGSALSDLIPIHGLPLERCLEIMLPVTLAVAAAHQAGIVHRDLKPSNLMVRTDGVVKVVDFGLAKMAERTLVGTMPHESALTRQGVVMGTVPYMSPEQLEARPADHRSDIFALGVTLFELASGRRPFVGASDASIVSAIMRDEPPRLAAINAELPAQLDAIIQRCLLKDPSQRYPDVMALHDALAALQHQARTGVLPTAAVTVRPAPAAAGKGRMLAAGALLVAIAVGAGLYWRQRAPAEGGPALGAGETREGAVAAARNSTIAVLPMRNLSSDPEQEYFSDGATEAMIADLAKVPALRVTARNSVMRYKGQAAEDLQAIAKTLRVAYLIQGSVMRAGDQVAIVVHLVDPHTSQELWGDTYHGSMASLLGFEGRVAEAVAREILGELPTEVRARLAAHPTVSDQAFEKYLRGRFLQNKRTPDNLLKALELFQQAIAEAPGFALAWSASAESYAFLGSFGNAVMPTRESFPRAEAAARKALELDDSLSEAHNALAIALLQNWQWPQAAAEFERTLALNPSNADGWHQYAGFLSARGRHAEAVQAARRARELDPLSLVISQTVGITHYFARDFDQAVAEAHNALAANPNFWLAHCLLALSLSEQGRHADAEIAFDRALELSNRNLFSLAAAGVGYARAGKVDRATASLDEIAERAKKEYVSPVGRAKLCFALGRTDEGFRWLDQAAAEHDHGLAYLAVDPNFDSVRTDPRFQRLVGVVGIEAR